MVLGADAVVVAAAEHPDRDAELGSLEDKYPKQHRLLRTLLDTGAPMDFSHAVRNVSAEKTPWT